jgi:perosamine synthetase
MASLQAALGLAQLEKVHEFIEARRSHAREYSRRLEGIAGLSLPAEAPWARHVHWMYALLVDRREFGLGRDDLRRVLAEHGVETRSFFVPMHCQPPYWHALGRERYPVAERLCRDGLILPSSSTLTLDEIDHVTDTIRKAHRR